MIRKHRETEIASLNRSDIPSADSVSGMNNPISNVEVKKIRFLSTPDSALEWSQQASLRQLYQNVQQSDQHFKNI